MVNYDLNADDLSAVQSTIKVTRYFFTGGSESEQITTWDLLVYCAVKGLKLDSEVNMWDRDKVERIARDYHSREKEIRLIDTRRQEQKEEAKGGQDAMKWWNALSNNNKVETLHRTCNAEGDATYTDPTTGYTVFSAFAHLRRGHCCGLTKDKDDSNKIVRTHRCRHCPYRDDGSVGSKNMIALNQRLRVIEYVRKILDDQIEFNYADGGKRVVLSENAIEKSDQKQPGDPNDDYGNDDEMSKVFDNENMARLRRKLVKRKRVVVVRDKDGKPPLCSTCGDERMVTCTRCNGFTWVFSPTVQVCPRCKGEGMHPCVDCTSYRPPVKTSIYTS